MPSKILIASAVGLLFSQAAVFASPVPGITPGNCCAPTSNTREKDHEMDLSGKVNFEKGQGDPTNLLAALEQKEDARGGRPERGHGGFPTQNDKLTTYKSFPDMYFDAGDDYQAAPDQQPVEEIRFLDFLSPQSRPDVKLEESPKLPQKLHLHDYYSPENSNDPSPVSASLRGDMRHSSLTSSIFNNRGGRSNRHAGPGRLTTGAGTPLSELLAHRLKQVQLQDERGARSLGSSPKHGRGRAFTANQNRWASPLGTLNERVRETTELSGLLGPSREELLVIDALVRESRRSSIDSQGAIDHFKRNPHNNPEYVRRRSPTRKEKRKGVFKDIDILKDTKKAESLASENLGFTDLARNNLRDDPEYWYKYGRTYEGGREHSNRNPFTKDCNKKPS